jgi:hypothetical protein
MRHLKVLTLLLRGGVFGVVKCRVTNVDIASFRQNDNFGACNARVVDFLVAGLDSDTQAVIAAQCRWVATVAARASWSLFLTKFSVLKCGAV